MNPLDKVYLDYNPLKVARENQYMQKHFILWT